MLSPLEEEDEKRQRPEWRAGDGPAVAEHDRETTRAATPKKPLIVRQSRREPKQKKEAKH